MNSATDQSLMFSEFISTRLPHFLFCNGSGRAGLKVSRDLFLTLPLAKAGF